jgi:hypothetical protein
MLTDVVCYRRDLLFVSDLTPLLLESCWHTKYVAALMGAFKRGYPLNAIKREHMSQWVTRLVAAGKKQSTVRHAYFLVRMALAQAVADGRLATNPPTTSSCPQRAATLAWPMIPRSSSPPHRFPRS